MIYTGYYAKLKTYEEAGLQPISIAGRCPDFYKGPQYKSLAPEYKMFMDWKKGKIDNLGYTELFKKHLSTLDIEAVKRALKMFGGDKDVILLCYEKPSDFCHRHIVADWLEAELGVRVEEYDIVAKEDEKRVIEDLKEFFMSEQDIAEDYYNIKDVHALIEQLQENPPEGYFLYKKIDNGENTYTLENKEEFFREQGIN